MTTNGTSHAKFIFFTDFDGTITVEDSNDHLTESLGMGHERRMALNKDILSGARTFRSAFAEMLDSVKLPFDACVENLLKHVRLHPGFVEFFTWCRQEGVPVVILSGGMRPIIEGLLRKFLSEEEMKGLRIVSNDVAPKEGKSINDEDGWKIEYHDDSDFGHDKSIEIRKYSSLPADQRPTMFYAGDGVSDLSAAKETDLLFAKSGKDLVSYCEREKVPFVTFNDFHSIHETVKAIVEGRTTTQAEAKGRL
ncbi:related to Phosphoserine phosphatase [Cephalotrichum gorgonifer]|uniref:Related to Phosphoserine phosphatase n=1 Tax=Cephalotrichum gorgonifer TaxID=2041049 RepID=A0AAE8MTK6_9PEZI|nr:related to Phosphoserine phosphatase [Cephalotrichum gorgonifer]